MKTKIIKMIKNTITLSLGLILCSNLIIVLFGKPSIFNQLMLLGFSMPLFIGWSVWLFNKDGGVR